MRISDTTRSLLLPFAFVAAALCAPGAEAASASTYDWSATLVEFDAAAGTAVLQARIEGHAEIDGIETFADGDRLTLVWTGRAWAADVRDLAREPALTPQTLSLPVEFVATARDGEYVNFRIKVPASAVEKLAAMPPGTRVTGVSPRGTSSWDEAVVELRHYNDVN